MPKFGSEGPRWLDEIEEVASEGHDLTSGVPSTVEVVRGPNRACILVFILLLIGVATVALILFQPG
jgi:hypothetical protein